MKQVTIELDDQTFALISRIAKEYQEVLEAEVASVVETWAQGHRDAICYSKEKYPDREYDENFDPAKEGYCSHHWHWPPEILASIVGEGSEG